MTRRGILLFAIGLLVPIASILLIGSGPGFASGDENAPRYVLPAIEFLRTGNYEYADAVVLPGYPLFLAALYGLFGIGNDLAVVIVQALMVGAAVVVVARTAAFMEDRFFWPAGLLAAITLNIGYRAALVEPELFFTTAMAVALMGVVGAVYDGRRRWVVVAGVGMAVAAITRAAFILFPVLTLPTLALFLARRIGWVRGLQLAAIPLAILAVTVGAWMTSTWAEFGKPIYSVRGSLHSLEWVYPCLSTPTGCGTMNGEARLDARDRLEQRLSRLPPDERNNLLVRADHADDLARDLISELPLSRVAAAAAGGYVKLFAYPTLVEVYRRLGVEVTFLRDVESVGAFLKATARSPAMWGWGLAQFAVFVGRLLQLVGLVVGLRNRQTRPAVAFAALSVIAVAAVTVAVGTIRFRAPAEPGLVLLAVVGGGALLDRWGPRVRRLRTRVHSATT